LLENLQLDPNPMCPRLSRSTPREEFSKIHHEQA
jgi:hypothetical protein